MLGLSKVCTADREKARAHVERYVCEKGVREIRLYTNAAMTENMRMYKKLGYTALATSCYYLGALHNIEPNTIFVSHSYRGAYIFCYGSPISIMEFIRQVLTPEQIYDTIN